ncbi:hypothetical protein LCGC14_0145930 [marine sediment metagenome]|uniref:Uncharacterized protein n=1 Tax=marine sediment metagenome TaxID=412755 RepID=A0A0F9VFC1_9ZZZZ
MKTQQEIVDRINKIKEDSFLGFELDVLLPYLDWDNAKAFLKEDASEQNWKDYPLPLDGVEAEAKTYMEDYGKRKAKNHRSLSASRTIEKMTEWMWLLGKDDLVYKIKNKEISYQNYGAPILKAICEKMGWDFPTKGKLWRMSQGLKCTTDEVRKKQMIEFKCTMEDLECGCG